jgi:hypothetical protein
MACCTLSLQCNASQLMADLQLLAQAAQRSPQVRQRLVDLGDLVPELVCSDSDALVATTAGECRIRLELPNAFLELVRAVRAGEFDGLVVQERFHE